MHTYILVPDSFKGTMSSSEICGIMERQIYALEPDARVIAIPIADGGEGSVDCFLEAMRGQRVEVEVCGPFPGERAAGFYGLVDGGRTAVIEMAACAGLPLVEGRANPLETTTFGVGELLLDAAGRGVRRIIVGLGGSATNDGGCGAAMAAGIRFLDGEGTAFLPTGGTLSRIAKIDASGLAPVLRDVELIAMCDIDNPMFGPTGAAHVFAPQKGADPAMVECLDTGLRHLAAVMERDLHRSVAAVPGAGAAGAMGAGMTAFFGTRLQMGIDAVLDVVGFDTLVREADLVLTGEGKIDSQSLRGKVVIGVARRAKKAGVPVVAVVGDIGDGVEAAYDEGVTGIVSINRVAVEFPAAKKRAGSDMASTVDNLIRMYLAFTKREV